MSKTSLALTSLVAALPAAYLTYIMVMTFLSHAGGMPMGLTVLAGLTLLIAVALALMPAGVMIFGEKLGAAAPKQFKQVPAVDEHAEESFEEEAEIAETGEFESAEEIDSGDVEAYDEGDLFADTDALDEFDDDRV